MPFIEFDESFSTGIQKFDEDHRHLVALLNKTYDDYICAAPDSNLEIILDELISYAGYHFAGEEVWMLENAYPKLAEHKHEHDTFNETVLGLQTGFTSGKQHISLDVLTFLKKWIKNHVRECDAGYSEFYRRKGQATPVKHTC